MREGDNRMKSVIFNKKLPEKEEYDVIVCGGGVAGCAAAYCAAKRGMKTILFEKSTMLGGLATLGLINFFVPMCNGRGKQIIFGLCEKWCRMSAMLGYDTIPKEWRDGEPKEATTVRYTQRYAHGIFALQLMEELDSVGVKIMYDCAVADTIMDENRVTGVVINGKNGLEVYSAKIVIDTTGDSDIVRRAGAPSTDGENYFTYAAKGITLAGCKNAVEKNDIRLAYSGIGGGNINLHGDGQPENMPRWAGTTPEDVNDYLIINQKLLLSKLKPEERSARDIAMLPGMPQFRTTCHINGEHTFTVDDAYRHFDTSIGAICDFERRDYLYEVPYGTLYSKDFPNLLAAGRCASATGYGWDVLRVIPPAIITGQAAGEAAVIAIEDSVSVSDVNINKLQRRLEEGNVMIHFPDELIPKNFGGENAAPEGHL
jgi:hypothetical protein